MCIGNTSKGSGEVVIVTNKAWMALIAVPSIAGCRRGATLGRSGRRSRRDMALTGKTWKTLARAGVRLGLSTILVIVVNVALFVSPAHAIGCSPNAGGTGWNSCQGRDPQQMGCSADAITLTGGRA